MVSVRLGRRAFLAGAAATLAGPAAAAPAAPLVLVIDPGHGGRDGGAAGHGVLEKDVVLAVGRAMVQCLAGRQVHGRPVRVEITRPDDRFLNLRERVFLARSWNADLLVSLHADISRDPRTSGLSAYTASTVASDALAADLAQMHRDAEPLMSESDMVSGILDDLAQRRAKAASRVAADAFLTGDFPLLDRSARFGDFVVLRDRIMPSVLLELGFLSNEDEAARLSRPDEHERLGRILAEQALIALSDNIFAS